MIYCSKQPYNITFMYSGYCLCWWALFNAFVSKRRLRNTITAIAPTAHFVHVRRLRSLIFGGESIKKCCNVARSDLYTTTQYHVHKVSIKSIMRNRYRPVVFKLGARPRGSPLPFFWGWREPLIKIFIISSEFHLWYFERLFAVAKTIGSPSKTDSLLYHLKMF